jgi:starch synthase (maltosyl-transferring)
MGHAVTAAPRPNADAAAGMGDGRRRVVIEAISPIVDGGRFPIKRIVGDTVRVEADAFADGHDLIAVRLAHRRPDGTVTETAMEPLGNDRWAGLLTVDQLGRHGYHLAAWIDHFATWQEELGKRLAARQDVSVDLLIGAQLVREAAARADDADAERLASTADLVAGSGPLKERTDAARSTQLAALMARHPDRTHEAVSEPELGIVVDPERARFSSWYELFPRSAARRPGAHGTLRDVIDRLEYVADLGFDVLYLPPIHPIGTAHRKGRNNSVKPKPSDPGVPWAIGSTEGGHDAVHPELGTPEDVRALATAADSMGISLALDLAYQASPDHPYVRSHPSWFRARPDGTVQYAENPPKKYQDIYPFDFETGAWPELWTELLRVARFWMDHGVRIFRVDNPHTKPFAFWEWFIGQVKATDPDVLFLAEAFTRPKVMYRLAKLGFSQSYTYFTWRNTKAELTEYFSQLAEAPVRDFFRPNLWPNTPDILHEYLQLGGRPAFAARLVLAATLGSSYGIYGPAFELQARTPIQAGSEEYLESEKYEIKAWDLDDPGSLAPLVRTVNSIRRAHPALQGTGRLTFQDIDNDQLIAYSKRTADGSDVILTVINLDPHHAQQGWLDLALESLGIEPDRPFEVRDLLDGTAYLWQAARNFVELAPARVAHVFHVRPRLRTEADFAPNR